jgi:heterotetrameric sarcosine oxidase gamma subunit
MEGGCVAELIPSGPLDGAAPVEMADALLEVLALGPVAAIQPWPGRQAAVDAALKARGLGFPAPGRSIEVADTRILWAGRETAFLIGTPPPELAEAAVIDLTDGWAGLSLSGPGAEAVLARLVPIDLRASVFPEGATARSLLGHVQALIARRGGGFELMVMRSYLRTAHHEVEAAMRRLAALRAAGG